MDRHKDKCSIYNIQNSKHIAMDSYNTYNISFV